MEREVAALREKRAEEKRDVLSFGRCNVNGRAKYQAPWGSGDQAARGLGKTMVDTAAEKFDLMRAYLVRQGGIWSGSHVDASLHRLHELLTYGKLVLGCGRCGYFNSLKDELERDGRQIDVERWAETLLMLNNSPHINAVMETDGDCPVNNSRDSYLNTMLNLSFVNEESFNYVKYVYNLGLLPNESGRKVPAMMAIRFAFGHMSPGRANKHMDIAHDGDVNYQRDNQHSEFMFFLTYENVMGIYAPYLKYIFKHYNVEDELREFYEFDKWENLNHMTGLVDVAPEFAQEEALGMTCAKFMKFYLSLPPGTYFYLALHQDGGRDEMQNKREGWHLVHKVNNVLVVPKGGPATVPMNNYKSNWRTRVPGIWVTDVMKNHRCSNGEPLMSMREDEIRTQRAAAKATSAKIAAAAAQMRAPETTAAAQRRAPEITTIRVKRRRRPPATSVATIEQNTGSARVGD